MVARSGQPIEHWYWGRVVHDMSGFKRHKETLAVDYCHDEECGFLDRFEVDADHNLVVSGALVATDDTNDRARRIAVLARGGVPYEASIDFSGDGIVVEEVAAGASVDVNGYKFAGPGAVIRQWPLRGVAVCPYGADMHTSSALLSAETEGHVRGRFTGQVATEPVQAPATPPVVPTTPVAPTRAGKPAGTSGSDATPTGGQRKGWESLVRFKNKKPTGEELKRRFAKSTAGKPAGKSGKPKRKLSELVRFKNKPMDAAKLKRIFRKNHTTRNPAPLSL
jgi:hypothetical protein